jgi:hypothetical protein
MHVSNLEPVEEIGSRTTTAENALTQSHGLITSPLVSPKVVEIEGIKNNELSLGVCLLTYWND